MRQIFFLCFAFVLMLVGIHLIENMPDGPDPEKIDAELLPYVERFAAEAKKREVEVALHDLSMVFRAGMVEVDHQSFCGYSFTMGTDQPPYVEIARSCWESYTPQQREILVFHELGHAVMQRKHLNDRLPSGSLSSLMNSLNTFGVYDKFTLDKRRYYLDELFLEQPQVPQWALAKLEGEPLLLDPFGSADTAWAYKGPLPAFDSETGDGAAGSRASALKIKIPCDQPLPESAFWRHITSHPPISKGSKLVLSAKLRLEQVTGPGVSLAVRGDHFLSGESPLNFSTKKETVLNGTGYREVELVVTDYFPAGINALYIFLVLQPGSTGTVYFDDVALEQYR